MAKTCLRIFSAALLCLWWVMALSSDCFAEPGKKVTFAFTKNKFWGVNPKDATAAMELFSKVISRKKGFNFDLVIRLYEDQQDLRKALERGEVDYVNMTALDYLRIQGKNIIEPFIVTVVHGHVLEQFVLLVNQNSRITAIEQLKGKRLSIIAGPNGEIGRLWLDTLLLKKGLQTSEKFFGGCRETGKSSDAVMSVYFKKHDACLVPQSAFTTAAELNPTIGKMLRIQATSPELLTDLTCYSKKNYDESVKKAMLDSTTSMHKNPEGKMVLLLFREDRLEIYQPSYLNNISELYREYCSLKKR